jgi:dTMP kinase
MAGIFITFEGGEGAGKSTQINTLSQRLKQAGQAVLQTREPGGTPLCESIRKLLQSEGPGAAMTPEAELLLFTASRAQLTRERILPALAAGQIVLCDRFMDSTTVYQGVARAIDTKSVAQINQFSVGQAKPDLTLLIDLPPEIGLERARQRSGGKLDRIEQEAIEFFQAVRGGYLKLAAAEPERIRVFDGSQPAAVLAAEIWATIEARLPLVLR